jgi:hypothetical protein
MEVNYTSKFFDSMKKMADRERWYWKTWDFFRYDLFRFFRNLWMFRKALYNYRWYAGDHAVMPFLRTAVHDIAEKKKIRGYEIESTSEKKIAKMKRAVFLLDHLIEEDFVDLAEIELGILYQQPFEFETVPGNENVFRVKDTLEPEKKAHNQRVYKRARAIENEMWNEIWEIFKGQDYNKFTREEEDHEKAWKNWESWYDGSGMNTWWD